jgi:hypothetical protein
LKYCHNNQKAATIGNQEQLESWNYWKSQASGTQNNLKARMTKITVMIAAPVLYTVLAK